ncbi:MAG: hypothetical protein JNN08_27570 [Bryobacterales bacterium]|nr:hypothetical protein [Bryobacterales bacterium]
MPNQTGPNTPEGKAASSRNATRHGLTSMKPVVTETDRPEFEALEAHLRFSLAPSGFLQELTCRRILVSAWNMQRVLKLENALLENSLGEDPLSNPDTEKQAALYQRYYARFESSYRANLREMERLQRLQLASDIHFNDMGTPLGALHDVQIMQRAQRDAKRNAKQQANEEDFDASLIAEVQGPRFSETDPRTARPSHQTVAIKRRKQS